MKNYKSLFSKVTEITYEFNHNLRFNEFEQSLTDVVNSHLAECIQEVLNTLMQDLWFKSLMCSIAGEQCLSLEGYRMVSVNVLNDQRILVSTPYFTNRIREKKGKKKQGRGPGNNIDCYLGLKHIGMEGSYSGRLASEICNMAVLSPSEEMAIRLLSARGIVINNKALRKVVRVFIQERVGLNGRRFRIFKFRNMVANAEALKVSLQEQNEQTGSVFKITNDPRVTRIGRFLIKSSFDELIGTGK